MGGEARQHIPDPTPRAVRERPLQCIRRAAGRNARGTSSGVPTRSCPTNRLPGEGREPGGRGANAYPTQPPGPFVNGPYSASAGLRVATHVGRPAVCRRGRAQPTVFPAKAGNQGGGTPTHTRAHPRAVRERPLHCIHGAAGRNARVASDGSPRRSCPTNRLPGEGREPGGRGANAYPTQPPGPFVNGPYSASAELRVATLMRRPTARPGGRAQPTVFPAKAGNQGGGTPTHTRPNPPGRS